MSGHRDSYEQCNKLAAKSLMMLGPFLLETHGRYVLTDKGRCSQHLQAVIGDLIFNKRSGEMLTVELKADGTTCKNLFLETWSNRNLDDATNYDFGRKPGWLLTVAADLLFYHFVPEDKLAIINLPALQRWAFTAESRNWSEQINGERTRLRGRLYDFLEKKQGRWEQRNDTWGRLVPIMTLMKEVKPTPELTSSRQLHLDIFGNEAA